jgi:hypothetical protein
MPKKKILKVGENKNLMVKDYQDLMLSKIISIMKKLAVRNKSFVKP